MPIRYLSGVNVDSNTLVVDAANDRVGIGTASPAYTLDINGVTRFQDIVRFKNGVWNLSDEGNNRFFFSNSGRTYFGSGAGYEWRSAADTALAVITDAGNVGIGTTSPNQKLQVNGFVNANGYVNSSTTFKKSFNIGNITGGTTFALGRLNFESVYTHHFRVTISSYYGTKTFDFIGYQTVLDTSVSGIQDGGEVVVETVLDGSSQVIGVKIGITTSVDDYVYTATIECLSTFSSWEDYSSTTTITPTTLGY
jgi:hypothetical protein